MDAGHINLAIALIMERMTQQDVANLIDRNDTVEFDYALGQLKIVIQGVSHLFSVIVTLIMNGNAVEPTVMPEIRFGLKRGNPINEIPVEYPSLSN